jgi:alcohol dehydrogenase class IV
LKAALESLLSCYRTEEWSAESVAPSFEEVSKGVDFALAHIPDLIIAAGGGGVLDMGKLIGIFAANKLYPQQWMASKGRFAVSSIPVVAIPSTAGTGSEATHFAVIWRDREKMSAAHNSMRPVLALVDPQFHRALPKAVRASSSFDALAQAIESYWCIYSTDISKNFAERAIRLILPCIALANFDDAALLRIAQGAYWAGRAIDITKTTAPHAISYALTGYCNIPHGHAVALTLPSLFEFNEKLSAEDCLDSRGVEYVSRTLRYLAALLGAQDAFQARRFLEDIVDKLALERRISKLGIQSDADIERIIEHGLNPERVSNNPRRLDMRQLREILLTLF